MNRGDTWIAKGHVTYKKSEIECLKEATEFRVTASVGRVFHREVVVGKNELRNCVE